MSLTTLNNAIRQGNERTRGDGATGLSLGNQSNLSDIHDDKPGRIKILFLNNSLKIKGRITGGIVSEIEGSPLGWNEILCSQVPEGINHLLRVHMRIMHEPPGMVGSDGEEGIADVRKVPAYFPIADKITAVPAKIDLCLGGDQHITCPKRAVNTLPNTPGPVLCR